MHDEKLSNSNDYDFEYDENKIYIIPTQDKPVKLIFEELPCPICSQIRCKHAKSNLKDLIFNISCTNSGECDKIKK
jgi:hypothetical protein